MFKKSLFGLFAVVLLLIAGLCAQAKAEVNFDFALPIFEQNEVNFEKTKATDYNLQILKKYIHEQDGNLIAQFHAITRWFTLIKLSDKPRHQELMAAGNDFFSNKNRKKPSTEEKLREVFYFGLLLSTDKTGESEGQKAQDYEELLLDYEEDLQENVNYWIAKGIVFQALKNNHNSYFKLMKPEEDLKQALNFIPKKAHYYYVMGQCFRYLGSGDSSLFLSIASYEKAASLAPRNQKLQNSLLSIYMGLHEEYQAKGKREPFWLEEAVYKKILEMAPNNPYALNNLGYLYAEYGMNTKTALELCQRAVDIAPENPGFHDSLGWAAFKAKNLQLAESSLIKSISLRSDVYESRYHLATVYYSSNQYLKAAEQYEEAIKLRPESAEALNNLAYLYTEINKNIPKALAMAKNANNIEPNNASYLDTLGWAYYRSGDLDNALLYLKKANNLVSGQGEILLHIGRVYLDKNDFDNALTFVKEAFKAAPEIDDPDNTLYLTICLKSYHEAIANYHSLLGEKIDKAKMLNMLTTISRLYQEEGLYDKAIEITKLCSEVKNGTRDLKAPLLGSYKLYDKKVKGKNIEKNYENNLLEPEEGSEPSSSGNQNKDKKTNNNSEKEERRTEDETKKLPESLEYPIAISFCSDLFNSLGSYIPALKPYKDLNITIFIDRLLSPMKTAVIRIETRNKNLEELQNLIGRTFIFSQDDWKEAPATPPYLPNKIALINGESYYVALGDDSAYLSQKPLSSDNFKKLTQSLASSHDHIIEIYFDWNEFKKRIPASLSGFFTNPIKPFIRLKAMYSYSKSSLNELIIATTGKEEKEDFMQKIAKQLFLLKLEAKKQNIDTTIKMKSEKDLIYISTNFEKPFEWLRNKVYSVSKRMKLLLPLFFKALPSRK